MVRAPNGESGWSSVSLANHGNVLTGKLPVPKGAEPHNSMISQAAYVTKAPLDETAQTCKQLLLEAGWKPYGENSHESPVSNSYTWEFKQNAVLLSANISDYSNHPGKTFITYTTKQLTADIPAPLGAPDFRYTDYDKRMHFDTKDSMEDVAAFYVKALGELGWKPTTEALVVIDKRLEMMIFRNEAGDRIDLTMHMFKDLTRVKLEHLTPADIAELDRRMKAFADEKKREAAQSEAMMAKRREARTYKFPIPKQAKKFVLDDGGGELEITMPGGTGPAALAALRKHFREAGWEEDGFSSGGPSGTLTVKRGRSRLWMYYLNIDKEEDFKLDVNCFSAYLKPVTAKKDGPASGGGAEPKPER